MLAKRTAKNQITIPKGVLKGLEGVEYFDVSKKAGEIILRPVSVRPREAELETIRDKIASLGMVEKDIETAIASARKNR